MEFLIWVAIMIVIALAKGFGKVMEKKSSDAGPPARRRRTRVGRASSTQPPHLRPSPRRARTARPQPLAQHQHREVEHRRKAGGYQAPATTPPPVQRPRGWRVPMDDLQEFLSDIAEKPSTQEPPPLPPPVTRTVAEMAGVAPRPSKVPAQQRPEAASPRPSAYDRHDLPPTPTPPRGGGYERPSARRTRRGRASQWTAALRDHANLRNIVVANEIIGPPIALRRD